MLELVDHEPATNAGVYGRQSRGNQVSVDDQLAHGDTACDENDWNVWRHYRDLVSASRFGGKARDEWAELVNDVAAGKLDIVVMWESSRGDRTPASWAHFLEQCRQSGVKIHAIRDRHTYDLNVPRDWKSLHDAGVDAGYESEVRSVDTRRGVAKAAASGKPHGRPGYGYTRIYDQRDRKVFEDKPNDCAPIAKEIITRVSKRDPVVAIARDLNERGIAAPGGDRWSRKAVKLIATNVRYIGKRSHQVTGADGVELHDAAWPAIVDEATFLRAQVVLSEEDRKTSPPGAARFLISYIATCDKCGSHLSAGSHPSNPRVRYRCAESGCMSLDQWSADEWILLLILGRLAKSDARALFASDAKELDAANAEIARLEQQLKEAQDSYADPAGGISAAAMAAKEAAVTPLLESARRRAKDATRANAVLDLLGEGEFTAEVGRPKWESLPVAARRTVVKALFKSITLLPGERRLSSRATDEQRMELASERITWDWA